MQSDLTLGAWEQPTHHGLLVALPLPPETDAVALQPLLRQLPRDEQARAAKYAPRRQRTFAGGRIALRLALARVGAPHPAAIPSDARGAPDLGPGVRASLSHKDDLACALASQDLRGHLGVDVETVGAVTAEVVEHILNATERAELARAPESDHPWRLTLAMATKEAVYKALDPFVRRYVGFHEATVTLRDGDRTEVALTLVRGEGPFAVDAQWLRRGAHIFACVRITAA